MREICDGLLGLAAGDALGVPVEFMTRQEIGRNPVTGMREYGTHHQPAGTWSDDTSLNLALMDSLVKCRDIKPEDIMERFSAWLLYGDYTPHGEVFDVGIATSKAIMNYGRGIAPTACGGAGEFDNGNGALMRILPLAFYLRAQPHMDLTGRMARVHEVCSLTHRHGRSLAGCGLYVSIAMALSLAPGNLTDLVKDGINSAMGYYRRCGEAEIAAYRRIMDIDTFAALPAEQISSSGYVVHTLEAALWCLLNTGSYQECVLAAVNLGEDTDTVGAVAGGLAGIYYGAQHIPEQWTAVLAKRAYLEELCAEFQAVYGNES